jgi:hypothetical protein
MPFLSFRLYKTTTDVASANLSLKELLSLGTNIVNDRRKLVAHGRLIAKNCMRPMMLSDFILIYESNSHK